MVYKQKERYKVLSLMSGTSLDGLDLCCVEFERKEERWQYTILKAETLKYSTERSRQLSKAEALSGNELIRAHAEYGRYLGEEVLNFIRLHVLEGIDFIASHGHTVHHQPELGYTFQLGHGAAIAATSGMKTISDFRSLDIALGGEGAPLVPIGDQLLFNQYIACVNLGGIANISFEKNNERVGYDVCAANMVLNHLTKELFQLPFDASGKIAASGKLNIPLFESLNKIPYFSLEPPKSLGREWVFKNMIPLIQDSKISNQDKLNTLCEHIAYQLFIAIKEVKKEGKVLITGGGAFNTFLVECIQKRVPKATIPDNQTVEFKEAIIFGLLGVLRDRNEINTLGSYTGAKTNSCGGMIYIPPKSSN